MWMTSSGCMRMRRGSQSFQQLSASYLLAQMCVSEEKDSKLARDREGAEGRMIDARRRPRPDTRIYVRRSGSVERSPPSDGRTHLRIRDTAG
jgi:hypothetical protein